MTAEIITIGDEILIGQITDTNSTFIAEQLNLIGVSVHQKTTVADKADDINAAIDKAFDKSDIILTTGGLGPTNDDITKQTLAQYFGMKTMRTHEPSLQMIKSMLARRNIPLSENNRRQAELPDCCTPILNKNGTAPAMWFEKNGKILVSMPGVPFEMKKIMEDVIPMVKKHFSLKNIYHRTVLTYGIPESMLADKIKNWENALPEHLHLAYLPSPELGVRLRLSAYNGSNGNDLKNDIDNQFFALHDILGSAIYGEGDENLAVAVGKLLRQRGSMMATAESCTGGHIANMITANAGSSAYYAGTIVSYANSVKINVLGVDENNIKEYGAVSEQVVKQMAEGARKLLGVDYAVATSGVAGPDGGTDEKPVGTVWIAVATPEKTIAQKHNLSNLRDVNIARASAIALNMLRLELLAK